MSCAHDDDDDDEGIEPESKAGDGDERQIAAATEHVKTNLKIILVVIVMKRYLSWVRVRCVRFIYLAAL